MQPNPQFPANLVIFTEETFNGKLYFLCSVIYLNQICIFSNLSQSCFRHINLSPWQRITDWLGCTLEINALR